MNLFLAWMCNNKGPECCTNVVISVNVLLNWLLSAYIVWNVTSHKKTYTNGVNCSLACHKPFEWLLPSVHKKSSAIQMVWPSVHRKSSGIWQAVLSIHKNIQVFEWLCHPFTKTIQSFQHLCHPFTRNIQPFEWLCHSFTKNIQPFKWLCHPFTKIFSRSNGCAICSQKIFGCLWLGHLFTSLYACLFSNSLSSHH